MKLFWFCSPREGFAAFWGGELRSLAGGCPSLVIGVPVSKQGREGQRQPRCRQGEMGGREYVLSKGGSQKGRSQGPGSQRPKT